MKTNIFMVMDPWERCGPVAAMASTMDDLYGGSEWRTVTNQAIEGSRIDSDLFLSEKYLKL